MFHSIKLCKLAGVSRGQEVIKRLGSVCSITVVQEGRYQELCLGKPCFVLVACGQAWTPEPPVAACARASPLAGGSCDVGRDHWSQANRSQV